MTYEEVTYKVSHIKEIEIEDDARIGSCFSLFNQNQKTRNYPDYTLGKIYRKGGMATLYECKEDKSYLIKVEVVGPKAPQDFFHEIMM